MKKPTNNAPLNFSTQSYPLFGRQQKPFDEKNPPQTVLSSPYYWWFMFLRLNEEYKKTCDLKGKGKYEELYEHFGDIHSINFKEWWGEKAHLFAEKRKGYKMMIAKSENDLASFNSDEALNLVVPLTWSQRSLKKAFTQLVLSKIEKGERGVSVEKSDAEYKLSGKWHIEAMSTAYKIYSIKKQLDEDGTKLAWADILIRAKVPMSLGLKEGAKGKLTSDARKTLTVLADRYYKRAQKYIKNSATKSFP